MNTWNYHQITQKLRTFFAKKGFIEVPAQSRLSILAACEDPRTATFFSIANTAYPLPQSGQIWLEYELLLNPHWPGVFCTTTSYRDEPNPIPGRHNLVFPMFEFEAQGDMNALRTIEAELLVYLGFQEPISLQYEKLCTQYETDNLNAQHELLMWHEYGPSISLEHFPQRSHPFWNMKQHTNKNLFHKIDVILHGMETIGSAERSNNPQEMYDNFFAVSDGIYAQLLFDKFGEDRVRKELDYYLSLPFIERFGGGIGLTRLERAMNLAGLLNKDLLAREVNSLSKQSPFLHL